MYDVHRPSITPILPATFSETQPVAAVLLIPGGGHQVCTAATVTATATAQRVCSLRSPAGPTRVQQPPLLLLPVRPLLCAACMHAGICWHFSSPVAKSVAYMAAV